MAKSLVLAEKPSVGRDIARVLNCNNRGQYFENQKYVVTWGLGHLVTLADPEKYDNKYKQWDLEDLPMLPERLELVVIKQTSKQYNLVKSLLQRNDISEVIIATDAGREGELVARWILEKAHCRKPIKRLWISSVTDKAIKDGFNNLKDGKNYYSLYNSAKARAEADWLVGINATRALTCKHNAQLSCGRVQTPTLAMIEHKEKQIKGFKAKDYYGINVKTNNNLFFTWKDKNNQYNNFDETKIDEIIKKINNKQLEVIDVKTQVKKQHPPLLFDLTSLQKEAFNRYGFSAKQTVAVMQSLYEYHKILTYPRTDSKHITSDIVPTFKERLIACTSYENKEIIKNINLNKLGNLAIVNNQKVSDHHAIIPTEYPANLNSLNDGELKIYNLVVKRFVASLLPPYEYEQTKITVKVENELFDASGKVVIHQGWKAVYDGVKDEDDLIDEEELKEQQLPKIRVKDTFKVIEISKTNGKTTPPKPFNEATLLSAMENPTRFLDTVDKKLSKTLISTGGLGTVATRADIIDKLFNTFLLEKKGEAIYLTSKGRQLLSLVPEDLKSPALTGDWEQKLSDIQHNKLNAKAFIGDIRKYTVNIIEEIKGSDASFKHDNLTSKKCPNCGKALLAVKGKNNEMLVCQDRECGHRETVSRTTNARCPNCHKKLLLVGSGENQTFVCKCGHKEKLIAFNKRKEKEKGSASKKDVYEYMKKNKNEKVINNPLAEALANFKFDEK